MKTILSTIALVAFAGAASAQERGDPYINAEGCKVVPILGSEGQRLYGNYYYPGECVRGEPFDDGTEREDILADDDKGEKSKGNRGRGGRDGWGGRRGGDKSAGGFPGVGWGVGGDPTDGTPGEHPQG